MGWQNLTFLGSVSLVLKEEGQTSCMPGSNPILGPFWFHSSPGPQDLSWSGPWQPFQSHRVSQPHSALAKFFFCSKTDQKSHFQINIDLFLSIQNSLSRSVRYFNNSTVIQNTFRIPVWASYLVYGTLLTICLSTRLWVH